jgi:heme iron utilization protein
MSRTHDVPKKHRRREPLYDTEIPTPSHAERARTLVANVDTGTLCTVARTPDAHPYGSFVAFGLSDGMPIFLVSLLAEHTKNMLKNDRVSLLVAMPGTGDPLARGRVTLVGTCRQLEGDEAATARTAYLEAHATASYYVDYKDFSFWGLDISSIRYIGGYGRMSWVDSSDWLHAAADPIASFAPRIIAHMNDDHGEAMHLMALAFSKATVAKDVRMTSIDTYGFEMSIDTGEGRRPVRVAFSAPIGSAVEARQALVALTKEARSQLDIVQE